MTVARASQGVAEVLRINTDVKARGSQGVVEVLRTNTDVKLRASQGAVEVLRQNSAAAGALQVPIIIIST
jgi:hypothetical protein